MKFLTMTLLSLAAATAMACPDLSGTYQCEKDSQDPSDSGIISIATDNSNGSTVYVLTDKEDPSNPAQLPTDGQTYQDGENSYTGSCAGSNFNVVLTGVHAQVGAYTVNMSYSLDSANNLVNPGVIKFNYGGQPQQQDFANNCARL